MRCCRYKLVSPSAHYTSLHQQMQQRLELCTTSVKLLKHNSSLTPLAAAQNAYDDINNSNGSDEQQQAVIAFVEAQLLAWMEVRHDCPVLSVCTKVILIISQQSTFVTAAWCSAHDVCSWPIALIDMTL